MEIKVQKLSADELKRIGVFNWHKAIIITLFFLFLFLSSASAEISLKAEVDKTRQSSNMSFVKNNIQRNIVYIFMK